MLIAVRGGENVEPLLSINILDLAEPSLAAALERWGERWGISPLQSLIERKGLTGPFIMFGDYTELPTGRFDRGEELSDGSVRYLAEGELFAISPAERG